MVLMTLPGSFGMLPTRLNEEEKRSTSADRKVVSFLPQGSLLIDRNDMSLLGLVRGLSFLLQQYRTIGTVAIAARFRPADI